MLPAIVIVTYNRPNSLKRLLSYLENAEYPHLSVPLLISVDFQDSESHTEVLKVANEFIWLHGEKSVIEHSSNLGLRKHVLLCGEFTENHGSIIMLEDDLIVSKDFYNYASKALHYYKNDDRIAGISLYNHRTNFVAGLPFDLIGEYCDVYFLQIASSWGQAWTLEQWSAFKSWYNQNQEVGQNSLLPQAIIKWPPSSWLKYFIKYLSDESRYFVYPRISLTSNYGDSGTHNTYSNTVYQVPVSQWSTNEYKFQDLDMSINVYDSFFEILPSVLRRLCSKYENLEFIVDLNGLKDLTKFNKPFAISSKKLEVSAGKVESFGLDVKPPIMNIVMGTSGSHFHYAPIQSFINKYEQVSISKKEWNYFWGNINVRMLSKVFLSELSSKLRRKVIS